MIHREPQPQPTRHGRWKQIADSVKNGTRISRRAAIESAAVLAGGVVAGGIILDIQIPPPPPSPAPKEPSIIPVDNRDNWRIEPSGSLKVHTEPEIHPVSPSVSAPFEQHPKQERSEPLGDTLFKGYDQTSKIQLSNMIRHQEREIVDIGINDKAIQDYQTKYFGIVDQAFLLVADSLDRPYTREVRQLFHCLILAESIGNPNTPLSSTGAIGLAQVMPIGALDSIWEIADAYKKNPEKCKELWGITTQANPNLTNFKTPEDINLKKIGIEGELFKENIVDPAVNTTLGAVQFLKLVDMLGVDMGVSGYNTGPGNIHKYKKKFKELFKHDKEIVDSDTRPTFIDLYNNQVGLGISATNENWKYLPRILAIYRKIYGDKALPLQDMYKTPTEY